MLRCVSSKVCSNGCVGERSIAVVRFDAHSDFGLFAYKELLHGNAPVLNMRRYDDLKRASVKIEVMTIGGDFVFWDIDFGKQDTVLNVLSCLRDQINRSNGQYHLIENDSDFECMEDESIGIVFALEGCRCLTENVRAIEELHSLGLRSIMLTANEENAFAGGCQKPGAGLTARGKELLKILAGMNVMLDLAHISQRSYAEVLDGYDLPVIVSHANARKISDHCRNLTDAQLVALREHGGVIGLSLVSLFIEATTTKRTTIEMFLEHMRHIKELIGARHIGLGFDFMDYMMDGLSEYIKRYHLPSTMFSYPMGIEGLSDISRLDHAVAQAADWNIEDIYYGNFLETFKKALKAR